MVTERNDAGCHPESARLLDCFADDNLVTGMNSIKETKRNGGALYQSRFGFGENFQEWNP